MEGKVKEHESSRREGRTSRGMEGWLREKLSNQVTFEQTSAELEEAGPIGNWQNSISPDNWNPCRSSEARIISSGQGSARRPVGGRRAEEMRSETDQIPATSMVQV